MEGQKLTIIKMTGQQLKQTTFSHVASLNGQAPNWDPFHNNLPQDEKT